MAGQGSSEEEARRGAGCVLIVDDHDGVRAALSEWLAAACSGVKVLEARDGKAALRHAESAPLDVVLMDLGMPGMNGIETTRKLLVRAPGLAVVVISVHDGDAQRAAVSNVGALAFIAKRRLHEELTSVLKPILEARLGSSRAGSLGAGGRI